MNYVSNLGLAVAALSLIGLGAAGLGYRGGCWSYKTGIGIVKKSGLTSLAAVVVCLIGLGLWYGNVVHEGLWSALTGLILGGCVLAITMNWKRNLDSVPYIHDITTDTENPPQFVNVLPLRANAENSAVYGGPEIARQQQAAYPDVKPIALSRTPRRRSTELSKWLRTWLEDRGLEPAAAADRGNGYDALVRVSG